MNHQLLDSLAPQRVTFVGKKRPIRGAGIEPLEHDYLAALRQLIEKIMNAASRKSALKKLEIRSQMTNVLWLRQRSKRLARRFGKISTLSLLVTYITVARRQPNYSVQGYIGTEHKESFSVTRKKTPIGKASLTTSPRGIATSNGAVS